MKYWGEMVKRVKCSGEFKENRDWEMVLQSSSKENTGSLSDNSVSADEGHKLCNGRKLVSGWPTGKEPELMLHREVQSRGSNVRKKDQAGLKTSKYTQIHYEPSIDFWENPASCLASGQAIQNHPHRGAVPQSKKKEQCICWISFCPALHLLSLIG